MKYLFCILFTVLTVFSPHLWAAESASLCINDREGHKKVSESNQAINNSLEASVSPLTQASSRKDGNLSSGICATCSKTTTTEKSARTLLAWTKDVTKKQAGAKKISRACIEASLQRDSGGDGFACATETPQKFIQKGSTAACLNNRVVDHIEFAVNDAIACFASEYKALDPRFVLKKINNETGFNFFLAYPGGKGIGQLTSDPVDEIAGWKDRKGKFIKGNAFYILEDLISNNNPSCRPFREAIKNDLKNPPPSPSLEKNYCAWVSPGDGLARNLVYSFGYYIHVRDKIIKPALFRKSPALAANSEIVNYFTLVAYGPGGNKEAKSLIDRLRINNKSNPAHIKNQIIRRNPYVKQTEEKMAELLEKMNAPATEANLGGDLCVK